MAHEQCQCWMRSSAANARQPDVPNNLLDLGTDNETDSHDADDADGRNEEEANDAGHEERLDLHGGRGRADDG